MKATLFTRILFACMVILTITLLSSSGGVSNAQSTKVATAPSGSAGTEQPSKIRWDLVSLTFGKDGTPVIAEGGMSFTMASDGSTLKLTGSGTFGPGKSDPVTGGGTWTLYPAPGQSTGGSGKYTVTGLISWELASGKDVEPLINKIGKIDDERAGLATLTVAYTNDDGSASGTGILVVSCGIPGSPPTLFEGFIATKGFVPYWNHGPAIPDLDANWTLFHVIR